MRGAISKSGGNASLAGERSSVWRSLDGHEGESRRRPRRTWSHLLAVLWRAALSRRRFRKGSLSSCVASHASSSSSVMPSISAEILSLTDRIMATASNFFSVFLIWQPLPWRPNLKRRIASAQIHRVVAVDPVQIDDVLEVPAHQHINATHGSDGDVLSIGPHLGRDHPLSTVGFGEFPCLGIKLKSLDVRLGHRGKTPTHLVRGTSQLLHREGGNYEDEFACHKALHKLDRVLREFLVLATSDPRRA